MGKIVGFSSTNRKDSRVNKPLSNIFDVARAFLSFDSMTHRKLQKICYYAYAVLLSKSCGKKELFNNYFEAWMHGPVCPQLYSEYSEYGISDIIPKANCPTNIENNKELYNYIEGINNLYGKYSGKQLESMTHAERPWLNAKIREQETENLNKIILKEDIIGTY